MTNAPRPLNDDELLARFRPVFADIAAGAASRERERDLPFAEIEALRAAGFGSIRIPTRYGGLGVTFRQYALLLIELAAADSNLAQALRGHFGFVESRIQHPHEETRAYWFPRIVDGLLFGNAQSERDNIVRVQQSTTVTRTRDGWRLDGTKYYTTGSIFADWLVVTAALPGGELANVFVDATLPGVERLDDWTGFGQRTTGSGSTRFDDVAIPPHLVEPVSTFAGGYQIASFQLTLLASLAGVGQAALDDTVSFVQARTRHLQSPDYARPAEDPAVQRVVGEVAGAVFAVRASVLEAATELDRLGVGQDAELSSEAQAAADAAVFRVQATAIDLVLRATSRLFEVGGGSAVDVANGLDRHWRNARTIASHNPAVFRDQIVGDYLLNGTAPSAVWDRFYAKA